MSKSMEFDIPLKVNIKQEKLTPPNSPKKLEFDEKKTVPPLKSSSELLAELFKVFNAAPPEDLLNENFKKKKSKNKHKKHKKRKHEDNDSDLDGSPMKKKKKNKKSKKSSSSSDDENGEIGSDSNHTSQKHKKLKKHKKSDSSPTKKKKKSKKNHKNSASSNDDENDKHKESKTQLLSDEKSTDLLEKKNQDDFDLTITTLKKESKSSSKKNEISIGDLKKSTILKDSTYNSKKSKSKSPAPSESSELSLSDEESLMFPVRRQANYFDSSKYYDNMHGSYNSRSRTHYKSRSRERDRHSHSKYKSRHDSYRHRSRSDDRSRSRSPEPIDKKRLLEIARKNAITMLKSGYLPYLAPEVKEKALAKMQYGGKSIDELTEYCRKLSNGEGLGDLSSISEEDSDHDKEGNDKAFNHPFVVKERGPIVMNIRNAVPIPPKTAEQTKAILMQYPVSSGQHHRANESEWVPVIPKPDPPNSKIQNIQKTKSKVEKITPQVPIPQPVPPPVIEEIVVPPPPIINTPIPAAPPPPENTNTQLLQMNQQVPNSIFPQVAQQCNIDISSVIAQRLNAMRKLQENPNDPDAQRMMSYAQQNMTAWVNSKYTPGQFTGSTGANILSAKELSAGYQPWTKKIYFIFQI